MKLLVSGMALVFALAAFAGEPAARAASSAEIRAVLLHLGNNLWCDWYEPGEKPLPGATLPDAKLRCRDDLWRQATDHAAAKGCNMVVIDLGEGLAYPSHPELAIEGSWSVGKMKAEVARLRGIGLEPIPKLNFSLTHNGWMGPWRRRASTPEYRRVCAELVGDAAEVFGHPRFIHIGYDEESVNQHLGKNFSAVAVRRGDRWWIDFLSVVQAVEKTGARAWAWADACWDRPEEFLARCPKSVLLSNWYYDEEAGGFDLANNATDDHRRLKAFYILRDAGYDQVPCGTTYAGWARSAKGISGDDIIGRLVVTCRRDIGGPALKGFLQTAWRPTDTPENLKRINRATDLLAEAVGDFKGRP